MNDVYRTAALICPACARSTAAPLREFQNRYCCDECEGMLIEVADFEAACLDLAPQARVEIDQRAPSTAETPPICPRCERPMETCRVRVGGRKLGQFSACDRHGLWFGRGVLAGAFAVLGRLTHGVARDTRGGPTNRSYGPTDASGGLSIAAWRNRPRKRQPTLTPVNAYRDQKLRCPACGDDRDLVFMGDRYGCEGCHGLFVEYPALAALVAEMTGTPWEIPAVSGAPGSRACPICAGALVVESLAGAAMIDRCAEHGVWFDPQELEAALQHAADRPQGIGGWLRKLF